MVGYERQAGRVCKVSWCERGSKAKGFCGPCYKVDYNGRDPEAPRMFKVHRNAAPLERLEAVGWDVTESGCWEWRGRKDKKGYGALSLYRERQVFAHRTAFSVWVGDLVEGLSICHTCDNPPCINPAHLWQGTRAENMQDMTVKERGGKTVLSADNVTTIRRRVDVGERTDTLAEEFNVNVSTIRRAINGETWSHVE